MYLLLLCALHSKPVVQRCGGDPTAEGPQDPTGPTQDAEVAKEAEGHSHQLALHCHTHTHTHIIRDSNLSVLNLQAVKVR